MSTPEERLKILNMIAEGKISAEDGAKLLSALRQPKTRRRTGGAADGEAVEAHFLRVNVTDLESGKAIVNVRLPISLVDVGIRMGARFVPDIDDIDSEELMQGIRQGKLGKIIDVESPESGEHVEVYLE